MGGGGGTWQRRNSERNLPQEEGNGRLVISQFCLMTYCIYQGIICLELKRQEGGGERRGEKFDMSTYRLLASSWAGTPWLPSELPEAGLEWKQRSLKEGLGRLTAKIIPVRPLLKGVFNSHFPELFHCQGASQGPGGCMRSTSCTTLWRGSNPLLTLLPLWAIRVALQPKQEGSSETQAKGDRQRCGARRIPWALATLYLQHLLLPRGSGQSNNRHINKVFKWMKEMAEDQSEVCNRICSFTKSQAKMCSFLQISCNKNLTKIWTDNTSGSCCF